jgi:hypothetical protein
MSAIIAGLREASSRFFDLGHRYKSPGCCSNGHRALPFRSKSGNALQAPELLASLLVLERVVCHGVAVERSFPMPCSLCKLVLVAALLSPMSALAQGGGGAGGGSAGGASSSGAAAGAASSPAGAHGVGSAGASSALGAPEPANVGGINNSSNTGGAGNAAKAVNTPGTNSAGTANSSGSTSSGGAPKGSTTVGTSGNPAGGATGGRIDGTVTQGQPMQGDDAIRMESSQDSKVDKKIKSICKGC